MANKVISLAQEWVGKKESDGTHREIIDIYNSHKPHPRGYKMTYDAPWCAATISALAIKSGYTNIIPVECSCSKMIELFKALGSWCEDDGRKPNPGDIIFYDWEDNGVGDNLGSPDHVGIVEAVDGNKITVIEGNYSNAVRHRTLYVNGKYIRGYGIPKYPISPSKSIDELAKEVLNGVWGNGQARKDALTNAGYDAVAVQKKVNELIVTKIKVGDTVKLNKGAKTYDGKSLASFVYGRKHKVKEINGNRAVITYLGVTVAAVNVKDLTLA
jgi:hypothetical protein